MCKKISVTVLITCDSAALQAALVPAQVDHVCTSSFRDAASFCCVDLRIVGKKLVYGFTVLPLSFTELC